VAKPVKGLHDARVGDILKIGIEGSRQKVNIRIAKIVANDRLQDTDGNIFDRSGHIFRRKGGIIGMSTKGKIVFAKHATQKELEKDLLDRKIQHLDNIKWKSMSDEKIEAVVQVLNINFGPVQNLLRGGDDIRAKRRPRF
jgi:hypothetical protein